MEIRNVCKKFNIEGTLKKIDIIKTGNINGTYKVTFKQSDGDVDYIVQSINTYVFKKPGEIMSNIDKVTTFIAGKLKNDDGRGVLKFEKTSDGDNYFIDGEGKVWRSYRYIPNSVTYDVFEDLEILKKAGAAFGKFQMQLSDFKADELFEIIPDFHNTAARYTKFCETVTFDVYDRATGVRDEIKYLINARDMALGLTDMLSHGRLPLRVTHNDTKCNNVLFDINTNDTLAVIDLDTVMPGLVAYDFGDAVRFAANSAKEDEPDLSLVSLNIDKFEAFTAGFMTAVAHSLTIEEIDSMYLGPITMALELSVRFLTDYLDGDKYFKTEYPGHNLVRARCQMQLAKDMITKIPEMKHIIAEYSK